MGGSRHTRWVTALCATTEKLAGSCQGVAGHHLHQHHHQTCQEVTRQQPPEPDLKEVSEGLGHLGPGVYKNKSAGFYWVKPI